MKILFLTLLDFSSYSEHNIYCDLLRQFIMNDNDVYSISPVERRFGVQTHFEENGHILKLRIGNTQKTNILEKGISTIFMEKEFISAIKKYFSNIKFDMILYSTPPITLVRAIKYVKKRDFAKTYLMLKDIFPQNAVDLGMMKKTGLKGLLYQYFRKKEKKLYAISDFIGCMSQANVNYILNNNPEISPSIVDICPNSIDVQNINLSYDEKIEMRKKYGIPIDKLIFVYGGNLGKPQGISFIIECLRAAKDVTKAFFLIVGDGTEYNKIKNFIDEENPTNVILMKSLPKCDYDRMIASCDVGLIFLDHRFTIPNFPSRLLSYMQAKLPILAATDINTDIGEIITKNEFGWWIESNNCNIFTSEIKTIIKTDLSPFKRKEYEYLLKNYTSKNVYDKVLSHIDGKK